MKKTQRQRSLRWSEWGQVKARRPELHPGLPHGRQGPEYLGLLHCSTKHISRKLGNKQNNQDSNLYWMRLYSMGRGANSWDAFLDKPHPQYCSFPTAFLVSSVFPHSRYTGPKTELSFFNCLLVSSNHCSTTTCLVSHPLFTHLFYTSTETSRCSSLFFPCVLSSNELM